MPTYILYCLCTLKECTRPLAEMSLYLIDYTTFYEVAESMGGSFLRLCFSSDGSHIVRGLDIPYIRSGVNKNYTRPATLRFLEKLEEAGALRDSEALEFIGATQKAYTVNQWIKRLDADPRHDGKYGDAFEACVKQAMGYPMEKCRKSPGGLPDIVLPSGEILEVKTNGGTEIVL